MPKIVDSAGKSFTLNLCTAATDTHFSMANALYKAVFQQLSVRIGKHVTVPCRYFNMEKLPPPGENKSFAVQRAENNPQITFMFSVL
jgi:hypothetical protein